MPSLLLYHAQPTVPGFAEDDSLSAIAPRGKLRLVNPTAETSKFLLGAPLLLPLPLHRRNLNSTAEDFSAYTSLPSLMDSTHISQTFPCMN